VQIESVGLFSWYEWKTPSLRLQLHAATSARLPVSLSMEINPKGVVTRINQLGLLNARRLFRE
jgi:hypothetical protein